MLRVAWVALVLGAGACGERGGDGGGGGGDPVDSGPAATSECERVITEWCAMACTCSASYVDPDDGSSGWCLFGGTGDFTGRRSEVCVSRTMEESCALGTDAEWTACGAALPMAMCVNDPDPHLVLPDRCLDLMPVF